jgi:MFS family permease
MRRWSQQIIYPLNFWILMIVSFLTIWGYGAQRVLVPVQMNATGTDILLMGVFLSFFGLPRAAMNILGGHLSDRFSKKYNILLSILLSGVITSILIGITESSFYLGLWRILLAVGLSWGTTAMLAYLSDITLPSIRGTSFGIHKMAMWGGLALSGFLSPFLLTLFKVDVFMFLMALLSVIGLILVLLFIHDVQSTDDSQINSSRKISTESQPIEKINVPTKTKFKEKIALSYYGCMSKFIEDGIITFFFPIYILVHYDNIVAVGIVISVFTIVYVISQPIGGVLADYFGCWKVINIGFSLIICMMYLLIFFHNLISIYIFAAIVGFGSGAAVTSAEIRASLVGEAKNRSKNLGYFRFYRDMGSFIGPIFVGLVLSVGNDFSLFLFLPIFMTVTFFIALRFIPKTTV